MCNHQGTKSTKGGCRIQDAGGRGGGECCLKILLGFTCKGSVGKSTAGQSPILFGTMCAVACGEPMSE